MKNLRRTRTLIAVVLKSRISALTALAFVAITTLFAQTAGPIEFGHPMLRDSISVIPFPLGRCGDILPVFLKGPDIPEGLKPSGVMLAIQTIDPAVFEYRVTITLATEDGERKAYHASALRSSERSTMVPFSVGKQQRIGILSLEIIPLFKDQSKTF